MLSDIVMWICIGVISLSLIAFGIWYAKPSDTKDPKSDSETADASADRSK